MLLCKRSWRPTRSSSELRQRRVGPRRAQRRRRRCRSRTRHGAGIRQRAQERVVLVEEALAARAADLVRDGDVPLAAERVQEVLCRRALLEAEKEGTEALLARNLFVVDALPRSKVELGGVGHFFFAFSLLSFFACLRSSKRTNHNLRVS